MCIHHENSENTMLLHKLERKTQLTSICSLKITITSQLPSKQDSKFNFGDGKRDVVTHVH